MIAKVAWLGRHI